MKKLLILFALFFYIPTASAWNFHGAVFPEVIKQPVFEITDETQRGDYYCGLVRIRDPHDVYAIVHEVGHYNFHEITETFLTASSIDVGLPFPICNSYVSEYAKTSYAEDAAESFAYFYFYRELFRKQAAQNKCLMLKYRAVYRKFYPINKSS